MAIKYYLICPACKEFTDLYKIRLETLPAHEYRLPAEGMSEEDLLKGIGEAEHELKHSGNVAGNVLITKLRKFRVSGKNLVP